MMRACPRKWARTVYVPLPLAPLCNTRTPPPPSSSPFLSPRLRCDTVGCGCETAGWTCRLDDGRACQRLRRKWPSSACTLPGSSIKGESGWRPSKLLRRVLEPPNQVFPMPRNKPGELQFRTITVISVTLQSTSGAACRFLAASHCAKPRAGATTGGGWYHAALASMSPRIPECHFFSMAAARQAGRRTALRLVRRPVLQVYNTWLNTASQHPASRDCRLGAPLAP